MNSFLNDCPYVHAEGSQWLATVNINNNTAIYEADPQLWEGIFEPIPLANDVTAASFTAESGYFYFSVIGPRIHIAANLVHGIDH